MLMQGNFVLTQSSTSVKLHLEKSGVGLYSIIITNEVSQYCETCRIATRIATQVLFVLISLVLPHVLLLSNFVGKVSQ